MQLVGSEVRVLNSAKLPVIWSEPTKTDKVVQAVLAMVRSSKGGALKDRYIPDARAWK